MATRYKIITDNQDQVITNKTITLKSGTASTAPLKFTQASAVLLTTPEAGAFECSDGDLLYYTIKTGPTRKTIAFTSDIPVVTDFATKALDNLASVAMNISLQWDNTAARTFDIASTAETTVGRALTISSGSTIAGATTNVAGGDLTLKSGVGKGTGASSIHFFTGTTLETGSTLQTSSEKMTILGSGNVGIGTTGPAAKFEIRPTTGLFSADIYGDSAGRGMRLLGSDWNAVDTGTGLWTQFGAGTGNTYVKMNVYNSGSGSSGNLVLQNVGGNVGIGTTGPGYKLDVLGTTNGLQVQNNVSGNAADAITFLAQNLNSGGQTTFYFSNDRTLSALTSYAGLIYGGSAQATSGLFGTTDRKDKLFIITAGASNQGMYVGTLSAQPFVIGTNNLERMRILSNGNVGIGETAPACKLVVNGGVTIGDNTDAGDNNLYVVGTITASRYVGLIEALPFEFRDLTAGISQTYELDLYAFYGYTVEGIVLEVDTGTLTDVHIKIGTTDITSLTTLTVDTTRDYTAATGANTVVVTNKVVLVTNTSYTGAPTLIRGSLKIKRT